MQAHIAQAFQRLGMQWSDLTHTLDVYAAHVDAARTAASGDRLVDIIHALRAYLAGLSTPHA